MLQADDRIIFLIIFITTLLSCVSIETTDGNLIIYSGLIRKRFTFDVRKNIYSQYTIEN